MASAQDRQLKWMEEFSSKQQMKLQAQRLDNLEELIQAKVPIIENLVQEVSSLKKELETEKRKSPRGNNENEQNFMECVEKLMDEIVQINLKFLVLEERIENLEKVKSTSEPPKVPVEPDPKLVDILATNETIQAKLVELEENQFHLQTEVQNTKIDLEYLNQVFIPPPVESILEGALSPPLGTPLQDLTNWAFENLDEADHENGHGSDNESLEKLKEEEVKTDMAVLHKASTEPGRYLQFLCLCGLEFETEKELSEHVLEKTLAEPVHSKEMVIGTSNPRRKVKRPGIGKTRRPHQSSGPQFLFKKMEPYTDLKPSSKKGPKIKHVPSHVVEDEVGNPRYFCSCGNNYAYNHGLRRHIQDIISGRAFKCKLCPARFFRLYLLKVHMRRKHRTMLTVI